MVVVFVFEGGKICYSRCLISMLLLLLLEDPDKKRVFTSFKPMATVRPGRGGILSQVFDFDSGFIHGALAAAPGIFAVSTCDSLTVFQKWDVEKKGMEGKRWDEKGRRCEEFWEKDGKKLGWMWISDLDCLGVLEFGSVGVGGRWWCSVAVENCLRLHLVFFSFWLFSTYCFGESDCFPVFFCSAL